MERYDVFKSQGGYAVALGIYQGCPTVGGSKWFKTKEEAKQFAENIQRYHKAQDEYEKKVRECLSFEEVKKIKFPKEEDYSVNVGDTV